MDRKYGRIKVLIMDVDGTLTDGGIYLGNNGEIMKRFHVKDGYAIHDMLPRLGIIPIVITGRESRIVENRCKELGIEIVIQGSQDKVTDIKNILKNLNISLDETAYIGDDLNDFECMKLVALRGCPQDAANDVKEICQYVTSVNGGSGVIREFVEWIKKMKILTVAWSIYDERLKEFTNVCTGGGLVIKNLCEYLGKTEDSYLLIGQYFLPAIKLGNIQIIDTLAICERYVSTKFENDNIKRVTIIIDAFKNALKEKKPDIVSIQGIGEIAIKCIKICKEWNVPVTYTEHLFLTENETFGKNDIVVKWEKELYHISDLNIIAVSNGMKRKILKEYSKIPKNNIHVILNGTDFIPQRDNGSGIKNKLNIVGKKVLICSGNISERKNQVSLVNAYEKISEPLKSSLVIIFLGKDRLHGTLQKMIKEKGLEKNLLYLGAVSSEEMKDYYAISDGLVMPSYAEGLSIAALEMITYGKPIIMFSDSECADDLNDQKVSVLVDERTDGAMAKAIEKWDILQWESKYIRKYSDYFTMVRVTEDYIAYFNQILGK